MNNQNNITELRAIVFDTLCGLKDKSIDIEHAKAISDTAQVIINSAKVEVDHAKHTGRRSTSFLQEKRRAQAQAEETKDEDEPFDPMRTTPKLTSYVHHTGEGKQRI
ncbi:hypothetical protein [Nitrosomonas communis]|uniref:Uncharacterized protein n=1 Tax=Nitrosomonas communis TaxID=44574 RepID=A0A1I4WSM9_9PROT|nr:hypothetical protein [Nitrosomonas communis]SFN16467.1 hypothetical protein SAMN05421863_11185 [Nitrosomonas communis]